MPLLSSLRSVLGFRPVHHKSLGHALPATGPSDAPTLDVVIWVLVDAEGRYVADADPDNLSDEYRFQVGNPELGKPLQLVKLTARLPVPRHLEINANS